MISTVGYKYKREGTYHKTSIGRQDSQGFSNKLDEVGVHQRQTEQDHVKALFFERKIGHIPRFYIRSFGHQINGFDVFKHFIFRDNFGLLRVHDFFEIGHEFLGQVSGATPVVQKCFVAEPFVVFEDPSGK
jgi:hypothetical protein